MTSIEWLIEKVLDNGIGLHKEWREQAKEMHKQEIIDAYGEGFGWNYGNKKYNGKEYYQETFVSKRSNDHISDISKMVELPQQEITDGEIQSTAETFWTEPSESDMKRGWKLGAKWYREQLKTK